MSEGSTNYIEAMDLYKELILFRSLVEENMTSLQALEIIKKALSSFPNIGISLRITLTIQITSSSAEMSFLITKTYKTIF